MQKWMRLTIIYIIIAIKKLTTIRPNNILAIFKGYKNFSNQFNKSNMTLSFKSTTNNRRKTFLDDNFSLNCFLTSASVSALRERY